MPDLRVPGIRNAHQTPPGVEVDNLDIIIIVGTEGGEGVPDPMVPGIRNGHQTPPPGINLDNLGIIFRTKGEKGYQTRAFRVSEMGTKPPPGINLDNLDCGNTSNIRFDIYIYVYITGHSDPAPTSAPSTGCVLLLSCG